ncbi:MAG TPA: PadR family transcriptional regulator [Candidatus Saccharimonadia bacterium]|nr:PadR family transcriptional regulator [Candidatus Saccharimonadia bacterium]
MYPFSYLPKPLKTAEFYVLLGLVHQSRHVYSIKSAAHKASLGSVDLKDGQLYPLVACLDEEGLIELEAYGPAGKSGKERAFYALTEHGKVRLQEEGKRLRHAVRILELADFLDGGEAQR